MGESLVEAPKAESKMGESVEHVRCLQQSVSFGRFEHDSLCWEKWSAFPSNKYLEEVEKCSTPGSVAKKAAYFEAHYKKIAARKVELLNEEKRRETELLNGKNQNQTLMNSACSSGSNEGEVDNDEKLDTQKCVYGTELENDASTVFDEEMKDVHVDVLISEIVDTADQQKVVAVSSIGTKFINGEEEKETAEFRSEVSECVAVLSGDADIVEENKELAPEYKDSREILHLEKDSHEFQTPEEVVLRKDEDAAVVVSPNKEESSQDKVEEREIIKTADEGGLNQKISKKTRKVTSRKTVNNTPHAVKKPESKQQMPRKSASPMPKLSTLSTPKASNPALSRSAMSNTRLLVKKENGSTPLTTKRASRPEVKRLLPASMHMSLSLGLGSSDPATFTTTRKSLIMERMGDKDIIKRAFRSFQSNTQRSPCNSVKAPTITQSAIKKTEQEGSAPATLQKKNEGMPRAAKPSSTLTSQSATRKTSASPGLQKTRSVDQRNGKSAPGSLSSKSPDRGNKQKEVSKTLEQKFVAKQASKAQLQANVKVEKGANIKKTGHGKLSSSCNQRKLTRSHKADAVTTLSGTQVDARS